LSTTAIQVLLVDDDEVSALAARTILGRLGCQVEWVVTGAEPVVRFRQETYDLVLMDSPRMDGFEATARIRGMPRGRVMPKPFLRESLARPRRF
jgi:CheY-like chemotaxis protein